MSNRHLPAGQNIPLAQGGPGSGMPPGIADMSGGPPPGVGHMPGHHGHPGPRRRGPPPHAHAGPPPQHHHAHYVPQYHQPVNPQMYGGYMPHYGAPQPYYGMPPQYPNGGMPSQGYMPYQQNYPRSPPAVHSYVHPSSVNGPPSYPRQHSNYAQSPAMPAVYHQPPPSAVHIPPHTPSSTHSSQTAPPPQTPPTPQTVAPTSVQDSPATPPTESKPFRAPLPWLSRPDLDFPVRSSKLRTRRRRLLSGEAVSLPIDQQEAALDIKPTTTVEAPATQTPEQAPPPQTPSVHEKPQAKASPAPSVTSPQSPQRSRADTASSAAPKPGNRAPATPAVPALPKQLPKSSPVEKSVAVTVAAEAPASNAEVEQPETTVTDETETQAEQKEESKPAPRAPPTSWANLFAKAAAAAAPVAQPNGQASEQHPVNGNGTQSASQLFPKSNATNLAEAIRAYQVGPPDKIAYIEPRGLINTGNMCYMNSILQVLMFCVPFYDFLKQVGSKAVHSFKSETPLVDAMIMFLHEFTISKSATSVNQLRQLLKPEDLEKFGEPFTPEFVYEAIRQLPRFASMRRGHQQDAEEFLGFLLQSLDDECNTVVGALSANESQTAESESGVAGDNAEKSDEWLEVGRKQKAAITRSSGTSISTPITKIFGGLLRSEFRVPGLKDSITTEPYQPLQLDIGAPDVRNVVDALRGLTRPERLHGDFNSPRGKDVAATKQVFIETLPPVLILHLKRFQFDAQANGTVKIWKKIDYPLELEIPREVLSRQNRNENSTPKYKLISVVYHHGKNASGGHYTVDVRRQDGEDWLRLDDTVLRRVASDDVAETGSEEEYKKSQQQKESVPIGASGNRFGAVDEEEAGDEDGWKQVTTTAGSNKRWSNVVNGAGNTNGNATKAKQHKDNAKDNKVAYLLFYQRV